MENFWEYFSMNFKKYSLLIILFILIECYFIYTTPVCYAAEPVPVVHSVQYENSHVINTDPTKVLYWITITWNNSSETRWLIVYDAKQVPVDGALDTSKIIYCALVSLAADGPIGTRSFDWSINPARGGVNGIVAIISTNSSGCTAKTGDGNYNWISAGTN